MRWETKLGWSLCLGLCTSVAMADFLPPNDLHLQDTIMNSNVTEEEFNQAIDLAEEIYTPLINEVHGGRLKINRLWSNNTVNASASQFFGTWSVNMYGGLARRPEVTLDGFTLVLCHELGHHLAGFPFSSRWAANEGQSDYFATLSCAKLLWGDDLEVNASFAGVIDDYPKALCDDAWQIQTNRDLCYRSMVAGKSLADLLSALREQTVEYDTPDTNVVSRTDNSHPDGQCRLDTYMAGALCAQEFDPDLIPGKDLGSSRNSARAEEVSRAYTCSRADAFEIGVRPLCWFKSQL